MSIVSAHGATVRGLFAEASRFRIPGYQRPFAWTPALAVRLLDDVREACLRGRAGSGAGGYFLSTIIASQEPGQPVANIVDGQQRITILTMLIALLRDLGAIPGEDAERLIGSTGGGVRVEPRPQDAAFFWQYVQLPGGTLLQPSPTEMPSESAADSESADEPDDEETAGESETGEAADADDDEPEEVAEDVDEDELAGEPDPATATHAALEPALDSRRAMLDCRDALRIRLEQIAQGLMPRPRRALGRQRANQPLDRVEPVPLGELAAFLLDRCELVRVSVHGNVEAHRVFTVMHTRGLDLTDADILKAELIGAIPDAVAAQEATQKWEDIEDRLGRKGFAELFGHLRALRLRRPPRVAGFAEFREAYEPDRAPKRFIDEVLWPAGLRVDAILNGNYMPQQGPPEAIAEIGRRLQRMTLLPNGGWIAVAMRLLERFSEQPEDLLALVRAFDTQLFCKFFLSSADTGRNLEERRKRSRAQLDALDGGSSVAALLKGVFATRDNELRVLALQLRNGSFRGTPRKRTVLVARLDAEHVDGALPSYADISVEHVLPQRIDADSDWLTHFPDPESYIQSLGNLLILPKRVNTAVGNAEFRAKLPHYQATLASKGLEFGLLREVCQLERWDATIVQERQQRCVELLLKLWDLTRFGDDRTRAGRQLTPEKKRSAQAQRDRAARQALKQSQQQTQSEQRGRGKGGRRSRRSD